MQQLDIDQGCSMMTRHSIVSSVCSVQPLLFCLSSPLKSTGFKIQILKKHMSVLCVVIVVTSQTEFRGIPRPL